MQRFGSGNPNWKGGKRELFCAHCKQSFLVIPSKVATARFCSKLCSSLWYSNVVQSKKKPAKAKISFVGPYSRLGIAKKCGHIAKKSRVFCVACSPMSVEKKVKRICTECGKEFLSYATHRKENITCSRACYAKKISNRQKGANSHLWRGGLTDENRRLRNSVEVSEWRTLVFRRDGYRCINCGVGGNLTADHIKPWSLFPQLRFEVSNGRTLCWPCHRKIGINPGQWKKVDKDNFYKHGVLPDFVARSVDDVMEALA